MLAWPPPSLPALPPSPGRLHLYDTAAQSVRPVGPAAGQGRLYVCGITPYDATHLGHAFTYLAFDLVIRQWRDLGLEVAYTQNVTDVDDPLLERAAATGADWRELAASQIDLFRRDMAALRIIPPDHYLGVVESLPLVEDLIARLQAAGAVYQLDDRAYPDWYAANTLAPSFGQVAHLDRAAQLATFAERGGDPDRPGKRDPLDALVWRLARPGEPSWPSRFGQGRPGWHAECVALALNTLGPEFDLQGGGADLAFPHHEMCAAQAETATGRPLARHYAHTGMAGLGGEKMSKSKGNLVFVSELLAGGADPMAIRLALLARRWREDWEWTPADLAAATSRLARWRSATAGGRGPAAAPDVIARLRAALRDDLDSGRALGVVDAWAGDPGPDGPEVAAAVDALLGVRL
jgi:L-cysteine:1D-myo-inositol 2-amino-2-deoxy-alpha-D-glucopyranoside ligase